ncbi:lysylphosphatidylglycerol synthase transmembrane domain-containing protein [uncultured Thiocystis sp.]|jgi:uncharacterized membrane protein YbhN (UPF0104 family)|uniref:lysylphosphatidylglycerol synthase transmembrane domain-containing protein n=1 Tax=uncultured Thiocystis sp. TaxID=1202134 RepID=UPI0025F77DF2|nr:lysylphosphatidylglycerol synthase transmembrane domain-containing protein [uncultured Thiocystis sp.]
MSPVNEETKGQGVPRLGRPRDWVLGGILLLALLAAVQWTIGWGPLLAPWRELSPWLLGWLFLLTALSYALRAVRVSDYFRPRFSGQFPAVLRLSILHNTANNLLPMRAGELVFPWLMRRYFGHGLLDSAAALLWIRLLDLHFLALIAILILNLSRPSWIWWGLALLWVAGLALIVFVSGMGEAARLAGNGKIRSTIRRVLLAAPRDHWLVARVYGWTALIWTLKFAAFTSLLKFFLPLDLWRLLAGVMGAELSSVLPFHGIAGSGSYELAAVAALAPLGVDPKLALAGAVNLHLFLLGSTLILGGLAFLLPKSAGKAAVGQAFS